MMAVSAQIPVHRWALGACVAVVRGDDARVGLVPTPFWIVLPSRERAAMCGEGA